MTTAVVDAAPASASEPSAPPPTTGCGGSEAMILCSALAEHAPALPCATEQDTDERLHDLMRRVLMRQSHAEVLAWRSRVPAEQWRDRWDAARRMAVQFWSTLPGVEDVPDLDALGEAGDGWQTPTIPTQPR